MDSPFLALKKGGSLHYHPRPDLWGPILRPPARSRLPPLCAPLHALLCAPLCASERQKAPRRGHCATPGKISPGSSEPELSSTEFPMACLFRRGNIELKSQAASPSKLYLPLVAGSSGVELKGNCEWRGHALSHSFSPGRLRDRKHSWEIQVVDKPGHGQFPMRELVQQIHVCPMLSWMYVLYIAYSVPNFNQRLRSNTHYSMLLCFHLYRYTLWYLGWKWVTWKTWDLSLWASNKYRVYH